MREKGRHTVIDKVKVRYLSDDDKYWAELVNFGHKYVHVPDRYVRDYDRLLTGGVWARVELRHEYDETATGKKSPFWIDELRPIQLATFDLEEYVRQKKIVVILGSGEEAFDRIMIRMFVLRLIHLAKKNWAMTRWLNRSNQSRSAYFSGVFSSFSRRRSSSV